MIKIKELEYECDGCGETEDGCQDVIPLNWIKVGRKHYCEKCAKLRDKMAYKKYPSQFKVHTPSGVLYACREHAGQAQHLYGVLGCHIVSEHTEDKIACINCMNERSENENVDMSESK
jgi:hypothetical protein